MEELSEQDVARSTTVEEEHVGHLLQRVKKRLCLLQRPETMIHKTTSTRGMCHVGCLGLTVTTSFVDDVEDGGATVWGVTNEARVTAIALEVGLDEQPRLGVVESGCGQRMPSHPSENRHYIATSATHMLVDGLYVLTILLLKIVKRECTRTEACQFLSFFFLVHILLLN